LRVDSCVVDARIRQQGSRKGERDGEKRRMRKKAGHRGPKYRPPRPTALFDFFGGTCSKEGNDGRKWGAPFAMGTDDISNLDLFGN
jgi:hypothetical protein